mmetsp:Transcript_37334/g.86823  ORF Transcript_37334/g.86823 Transcript_37334/m.86823 type:complete len:120 (-) Transcript_37334:74-433(-)
MASLYSMQLRRETENERGLSHWTAHHRVGHWALHTPNMGLRDAKPLGAPPLSTTTAGGAVGSMGPAGCKALVKGRGVGALQEPLVTRELTVDARTGPCNGSSALCKTCSSTSAPPLPLR